MNKVKSSLHKEKWLSIIKECQSSGMTIRAYCKQNDIKEATFHSVLIMPPVPHLCDLPIPALPYLSVLAELSCEKCSSELFCIIVLARINFKRSLPNFAISSFAVSSLSFL